MINEYIGWIGAFFFAICAIPQAMHTWKTKKTEWLAWLFLWFWLLWEVLTFTYIVQDDIMRKVYHIPLYVNYIMNILIVLYLMYAKKVY